MSELVELNEQSRKAFLELAVPEPGLLGPYTQSRKVEPWSQAALSLRPWRALCSLRPASLLHSLHPYCCVTLDKLLKLSGPQLSHLESGDNSSSSTVASGEKEMS